LLFGFVCGHAALWSLCALWQKEEDIQMAEIQEREPFHWQSAISYKTREKIVVRGYDVNELTGNINFAEMLHLVWKGELPEKKVAKMVDALLVCFSEHAMSPSSAAARMVMSGAGYIMPGLAGGILSIGYTHVDAHEAAQTWITAVERKGLDLRPNRRLFGQRDQKQRKGRCLCEIIWGKSRDPGMASSPTYSRSALPANH
jgi:citrate synthase